MSDRPIIAYLPLPSGRQIPIHADRPVTWSAKKLITPEMIEAGVGVLQARWVDLVSISEPALFSEVVAEILMAVQIEETSDADDDRD